MSELEMGREREHRNQEIIRDAVQSLDAYDSDRALAANAVRGKGETYPVRLPDRRLTFIGTTHTNNPEALGVVQLRKDVLDTLSTVPAEDVVFMIEGRNNGIDTEGAVLEMEGITNVEDAVKKSGESGVALFTVAHYKENGVDVAITSPEKPEHEILESLKQTFTAGELAAYLAIRKMTNVFRKDRINKGPETMLEPLAREFYHLQSQTGVDWIKDMQSVTEIGAMIKETLVTYQRAVIEQFVTGLNTWLKDNQDLERDIVSAEALLNQDEAEASMIDISQLHDPLDIAKRKSRINALSASWNGERDKYLVEQIGKVMAAGKKPYVIYGASHATHLEPALRQLGSIE